jgi:hypothetical protein
VLLQSGAHIPEFTSGNPELQKCLKEVNTMGLKCLYVCIYFILCRGASRGKERHQGRGAWHGLAADPSLSS